VKEKKAMGAPAKLAKLVLEMLEAVLLKDPNQRGAVISPVEWVRLVKRVNISVPEWQKSDQSLRDYLTEVLVKAGRVERVAPGLYRIL
jgi:hypothetical protein